MSAPALPSGVRLVRERRADGDVPLHTLAEWEDRFPWLIHGTTGHRDDGGFDLGLFGDTPVGESMARWRRLRESAGTARAVHSLQVHERSVREAEETAPGLHVVHGFDGHVTSRPGVLLTVSVADCVPISLVDPVRRRVALLHGGWRGTAAGIVAAGLERLGGSPADHYAHLGPAICGDCYEVGPEVHEALGLPVPAANSPVDVRAVQARQLERAGLAPDRITVSEHCTLCGSGFFSHRGGSPGRQLGVLGLR